MSNADKAFHLLLALIGASALIIAGIIQNKGGITITFGDQNAQRPPQQEVAALDATTVPNAQALPSPTLTPVPTVTQVPTATPLPTATAQPTATRTPIPTPTPLPAAGTVVYDAAADGFEGWAISPPWNRVDGMLVNGGGANKSWIAAPFELGEMRDYAVEAEIQVVNPEPGCGSWTEYGLVARAQPTTGNDRGSFEARYLGITGGVQCREEAAIWSSGEVLARKDYNLTGDWHVYRLEVQGNAVRLLIDGALIIEAIDNRNLSPGVAGLYVGNFHQISVRTFKVIAL